MSIRHRVKGFLKRSLKRVTNPQGSANTAQLPAPVVNEAQNAAVEREKTRTDRGVIPGDPVPSPTTASHKIKEESKAKSSVEQDKIEKHRRRVKLGLLKYVNKKDSSVELAELHEFSERRYLVGHQAFSQLMEELVDGQLLDFDWEKSEARLSLKGQDFLAEEE